MGLPSRVTETLHTGAPFLRSAPDNQAQKYPCQVAVRPWLSLTALFPSPCKGDNPILRSSGHTWEADEKMKVYAGSGASVPILICITEPLTAAR